MSTTDCNRSVSQTQREALMRWGFGRDIEARVRDNAELTSGKRAALAELIGYIAYADAQTVEEDVFDERLRCAILWRGISARYRALVDGW